jgi:hypothetical protein
MRHKARRRCAFQYRGKGRIAHSVLHGGGAAILFALCAGLQACSTGPDWPTLGKISDLTNIMTAEQRQKAVQDLQKNDKDAGAGKTAPAP